MIYSGNIWKFGNDVDTDQIMPSQYLVLPSIKEMSKHTMEPCCPNFSKEYKSGEIIVGGKNFGCGSSREQAPAALKELGVKVIIAESFARIFFRNCINLGILLLEVESTSTFKNNDDIEVNTDTFTVYNKSKNKTFTVAPISDFLINIINQGGYVNYIKSQTPK